MKTRLLRARWLWLLTPLALLAGCAGLTGGPAPAAGGGPSPSPSSADGSAAGARIWQYPASDFPAMCIVMQSDGGLHFVGGFRFFDPGRWLQEPGTGLTRLVLGGTGPFPGRVGSALPAAASPASAAATGNATRPAVVLRSDPAQRSLDYRIGPNTPAIEFAGFVFFRSPSCSAGG